MELTTLAEHLYVHYAASAAEHLFSVAAGLDSMVVGEAQILGQLRTAYGVAAEVGAAGRVLHELAQRALRVGKRVHTDTTVDEVGPTVVSAALELAAAELGEPGLVGRRALVVGAGSMGALTAAHLRRAGIGELVIANRTPDRADRLAAATRDDGVSARAVPLSALAAELRTADLLVACTGATGAVVPADLVAEAVAGRRLDAPLVICDIGLPRDVDPAVGRLPEVRLVDLGGLDRHLRTHPSVPEDSGVPLARELVTAAVAEYLAEQRSAEVTPTVIALRQRASDVVDAELLRLTSRLPDLDPVAREEVARTVRRVVDKLLHTPTVRVKRLAQSPGGDTYTEALRELFGLDPQAPAAVATPRQPPVGPR
jgi:glutamyl-tRNA reductase